MNAPLEQDPQDFDFAPGSTFGRYRIVRCIGTGGMGAVFEGHHELLSRRVAIKVLHAKAAEKADARERFLREARSVARIRHPHVVDVFDVGILNEKPYLVMEYLEGETLEATLDRIGRMDDRAATAVLLPIAAALAAVHRHGMVHRDVKPENIFLATDARGHVVPKLVDFGIAKDLSAPLAGSNHTVVGTPHFMSPEQARGSLSLDARTDQYSFGVLAYEMLTGRMPFDADSLLELVRAIDAGQVVPPTSLVPTVDPRMESLVLRAMSRDAESRFASMREVGIALLEFASPRVVTSFAPEFRDDDPQAITEPAPIPPSLEPAFRSGENTLDRIVHAGKSPRSAVSGTHPVVAAHSYHAHAAPAERGSTRPWLLLAGGFGAILAALALWAFVGRAPTETEEAGGRTVSADVPEQPAVAPSATAVAPALPGAAAVEAAPTTAIADETIAENGAPADEVSEDEAAPADTSADERSSSRRAPRMRENASPAAASSAPALHIRLER